MLHAPNINRRVRSLGCCAERGQAAVEFALVVPILLVVMFAAISFGDVYWKYQQLSAAASEGARTAIVSRNDADRDGTVEQATKDAAPNLHAADMDVTITSSWTPGDDVTVRVSYPANVNIMGIVVFNDDLVSTRTMRVEQ